MLGPTPAGRIITVVVDRDTDDHGRWHVMTAWDATPAQVALYRRSRQAVVMCCVSDVHDHLPEAFDDALADAAVFVTPGNPDIAVTVTVPVDPTTLDRLTERATREGRDIEDVVADALRAAAA